MSDARAEAAAIAARSARRKRRRPVLTGDPATQPRRPPVTTDPFEPCTFPPPALAAARDAAAARPAAAGTVPVTAPITTPMTAPVAAAMTAPTAGETYVGPFDREQFPERLTARVVEPGVDARIHGYHVANDLARHHGLTDVLWLALRGELPTEGERTALDVACALLAPVHVGQAASHAAYLARLSGAAPAATLAIGAVGLGELVRHEREALAPWLAWLERGGPVPACALAGESSVDAAAAQRWLDGRLRSWFGVERGLPKEPLTRVACAYALLHHLGLRGPLALETVTMCARLPLVAAEAAHARAGGVRDYPARLPDYRYVDGEGVAS
jgi:hypothetical protein